MWQNPTFYTALCFISVIMLMLKLKQEKQQACPVLTTFRANAMEVGIHLSKVYRIQVGSFRNINSCLVDPL